MRKDVYFNNINITVACMCVCKVTNDQRNVYTYDIYLYIGVPPGYTRTHSPYVTYTHTEYISTDYRSLLPI